MTDKAQAMEQSVWTQAKSMGVISRSIGASLFVGVLLTATNQFQALLGKTTIE